jgi:myo-inositol-1(or 4)-monophosphatase
LPGPEADLALLIDAARTAGEIARAHFRSDPEIWTKSDDSPVTEADIAIDRVLRTDLLRRAARLRLAVGGNRGRPRAASAQRSFVVDPIDGTRAFIEGQTSFAHSLAVVDGWRRDGGRGLPADEGQALCRRERGGATLNEPIRCRPTNRCGGGHGARHAAQRPAQALEGRRAAVSQRAYRPSIAYRLALVAEGRFDAMLTFRDTWEWDIAAGAILIAEAGGTVSDAEARASLQ